MNIYLNSGLLIIYCDLENVGMITDDEFNKTKVALGRAQMKEYYLSFLMNQTIKNKVFDPELFKALIKSIIIGNKETGDPHVYKNDLEDRVK